MSNRKKEILLLIGIIFWATVLVGIIMSIPKFSFIGGSDEGWLGYWGSIVGVIGAYFVLRIQIKKDKKEAEIQSIDNTFFNLLEMHYNLLNEKKEELHELYDKISLDKKNVDKEKIKSARLEFICSNEEQIKKELKKINTKTHNGFEINLNIFQEKFLTYKVQEFLYKSLFDEELRDSVLLLKFETRIKDVLGEEYRYYMSLETNFTDYYNYFNKDSVTNLNVQNNVSLNFGKSKESIKRDLQIIKQIREGREGKIDLVKDFETSLSNIESKITELMKENILPLKRIEIEYSKKEIEEIVTKAFNESKVNTGHYFRLFYRIIKYINDNQEHTDLEQKKIILFF